MDTDDDLPMNKYFEGYFDAHQLYHSGLFEECIGAAKYNITDPVMPRYHQMKNLILIVAALDGGEEADRYLEKAETIYEEANRLAGKTDEKAQTSLRQVRKDMDELIQGMNEDWEAEIHSHDEEAEVETGEEQDSSEVPRAAKQAEAQVYCPRVSANTEIRPTQIEGDEKRAKGCIAGATESTLADMQKQIEELRETMAASLCREKDPHEEQASFLEVQVKALCGRNVRIHDILEQR